MSGHARSNLYVGLITLIAALVTIFVWVPLDTDSGIIEKVRGRLTIGDALAPTIAAGFMGVGALLLLLTERKTPNQPSMSFATLKFICSLLAVIFVGILVMRYAGPTLAELYNLVASEPVEYRLKRATPGWKHIGFVMGGVIIVAGMIAIVERKFTRRAVLTAILAILLIVAVFDLPFDDLLLPPNGDV